MTAPPAPGVAGRIRQRMDELSPAERQAARTLLANYPIAGLEPAAAFAQRAGVSPPTVVRLATRLGYRGYAEMQRDLREEVQARMVGPLLQYDRAAPAEEGLLARAQAVLATALERTFAAIAPADLDLAAGMVAGDRGQVHCLGGRFSGTLARYLYAHLYQLRPGVALVDPGLRPLADALVDVRAGDVVVLFDFRRYSPDVVTFGRVAAEQGARLLVITDPLLSPAASGAECVLAADVSSPSPYDSMVAAAALVEVLVARVVQLRGDAARAQVQRLEELRRRLEDRGPGDGGPEGGGLDDGGAAAG